MGTGGPATAGGNTGGQGTCGPGLCRQATTRRVGDVTSVGSTVGPPRGGDLDVT